MRVAVNAMLLWTRAGYRKAGIGRHIINTLDQLAAIGQENEYEIFVPEDAELPGAWTDASHMRFHRIAIRSPWRRIYVEHFKIGPAAKRLRCDVLFALHPALPVFGSLPKAAMIHDAFVRTLRDTYRGPQAKYQDLIQVHACAKCKRIVTVSEDSKREIAREYGKNSDQILVAYNGLGNDVSPMSIEAAKAVDLELPFEKFLFTVSTLEPRKNLAGLIEAMSHLSDPTIGLAVAGAKGWKDSSIFEVVRQFGMEGRVHFLGYVPDEALPALFARCEAFVFTSLAEGFGIPALEAMTMGAPLVTSQGSSLPEVAGEAAFYADPRDPKSIAKAIDECLSDPVERGRRVAIGLERAKTFSWARSTHVILQAMREAADKTRS